MTTRIGPQMASAVDYVSNHPGCCKWDVARYTNPRACRRNNAIAYGPVNRAIEAGLIAARRGKGNRYALYTHEDAAARDRTIERTYGVPAS